MFRSLLCLLLVSLACRTTGETLTAKPDVPPRPISRPVPEYPETLKALRITGSAIMQAVIDEEGHLKEIIVEQASREEFGRAAKAALTDWRFEPAMKQGKPCAVRVSIPVDFGLSAADLAELEVRRPKEVLPAGPAVYPVEELDAWPELKKELRPSTPAILSRERRLGQAVMMLIVDEEGVPRDVHALVNTHAECAEAAAEVIKKWRFTPGRKAGAVVRTALEVTMVFFPENQSASGLRVRPGVRSGNDGENRLPEAQREARPIAQTTKPPRIRRQAPPDYPEEMSARWRSGQAIVEFIIDEKGRVTHVRTVKQTNEFFAAMAERAISRWEFSPALQDGQPVPCRAIQNIEFGMSGG